MPPEIYHLPLLYEPFASLSHLLAAVLFVWLGALMLRNRRPGVEVTISTGVYVAAIVLQFLVSAAYHSVNISGATRETLRQLDHAAIFVLIAGTFTPALTLLYQGPVRSVGLAAVWTAAGVGVVVAVLFGSDVPEGLYLTLDLALGWSGVIVLVDLWRRFGWRFVAPMVAGGSINSLAGVCQYYHWPMVLPGVIHAHEVFHVVVIVGSVLQYCFLWQFVVGPAAHLEAVAAQAAR